MLPGGAYTTSTPSPPGTPPWPANCWTKTTSSTTWTYGTGEDAFVASVEGLAAAPVKTTVHNIRAFADEDYVFLQTVYNFAGAGDQVAFDIFRFDGDGKIAEHWDVMETIADESTWQNPNGKF